MTRRTVHAVVLLIVGSVVAFPGSEAGFPNLNGSWVMIQEYAEIATLPFAGQVSRSSTVVQLVTIVQTGSQLALYDTYCFTEVNDGTPLVSTRIPPAFMHSLRPGLRTAQLIQEPGGLGFIQDEYVEVRGADLADPVNDSLPRDGADVRVRDQDEDGAPGMTVHVSILGLITGETYVVQRVRYVLRGTVSGEDTIRGRIEWETEQVPLGASTPLLQTEVSAVPDPDPAKSRFVLLRADVSATCAELRVDLDRLLASLE